MKTRLRARQRPRLEPCEAEAERLRALVVTLGARITNDDVENARLRQLVLQGLAVVDDFARSIGQVALQDYGAWNSFCLEARKLLQKKTRS